MKKLLLASAALALSTSFAAAHHPAPPPPPSPAPTIAVTTGNNWSKISNTIVGNKGSDITVVNAVSQNTGLQVPVTIIGHGPLGGSYGN